MLPFQMIAGGTFTSTTANIASGADIIVQSQNPPDFYVMRNLTQWGAANKATAIEWMWEASMAQGAARGVLQSSAAIGSAAMTTYTLTTNGIATYDTSSPPTFAALASTAVTGIAGTFVVSMASTSGINVGDMVRLYNQAGMQQISGYVFGVTAVTANVSITLGYMASSGITFAADATTGFVQKVIPKRMYPRRRYIANITKATQAVIYFTEPNDYTPGEFIGIRVPFIANNAPTMQEINNLDVRVLSVVNTGTVSSVTVDLDTTGFTTFAFATSAQAVAGISPSISVPSSAGVIPNAGSSTIAQEPPGTDLLAAFDNRNARVIHLYPGLFNISSFTTTNGDVWSWQAYKYDYRVNF